MPTRRLFAFLAAAVAAVGVAGTSRADFVIDDFSVPSPAGYYQINLLNGNPYVASDSIAGGLTRDLSVNVISPSAIDPDSASGFLGTRPSGTIFSLNTSNDAVVTSTLTYSGFAGLLSDFSMAGAINLAFINLDSGNTASTTPITLNLITGSGILSYTGFAGDSATPFSFSASIGDFTGTGDLSDVTGLEVVINGPDGSRQAADFVLDEINVSTVPAPPAAVLGLVALPVIGLYRRLRGA